MSVGTKDTAKQAALWIPYSQVAGSPGHPFYRKLNDILKKEGFDPWAENLCSPFFKRGGRPSIPPGVYFRMLAIGYFEGIASERGIAWRCDDSRSLKEFLGYDIHESTPDHSTLSIWRQRLSLKVYQAVFLRILGIVERHGLLSGETLGVDSSTMEANAAMRSIVRKDTKENYRQYLDRLIKESGGLDPTPEERVRFDRKRKKKLSNKDWQSETDPDARIARMKNGETHMAYKAENAVDLDSSVIVSARVTPADKMDPQTLLPTVKEAEKNLHKVSRDKDVLEVVADKGYHSAGNIKALVWDCGISTYIPERECKGRRHWDGDERARREFHANRRRCKGEHGKALGRKRANLVERAFAHTMQTGGLSRITVRGLENVQKRYLIHVVAYNLGVLMRSLYKYGTPRGAAERRFLAFLVLYLAFILALLAGRED